MWIPRVHAGGDGVVTATEVTTRERILDAALELTSRKGADGTSMREGALQVWPESLETPR